MNLEGIRKPKNWNRESEDKEDDETPQLCVKWKNLLILSPSHPAQNDFYLFSVNQLDCFFFFVKSFQGNFQVERI